MDIEITKEWVLNTDLDEIWNLRFKENSKEQRYRELIFNEIDKIGVVEWFKARELPIESDSIYKNRYTGTIRTLAEYMGEHRSRSLKEGLMAIEQEREVVEIYLWENWLPVEIWNDKEMFEEYKHKTEQMRLI